MSRPPLAREKVLDAFESILIDEGERAATMDATARAAGVSKGGLLYHYGSKDALEQGLIERLIRLARADVEELAADPEGPVAAFMRTSVQNGGELDRAITAVSRLAQAGRPEASDALRLVRDLWSDMLRPFTRGETALHLVMLVSDGLYFNNTLIGSVPGPVPSGRELTDLIALVERTAREG